MSIFSSWKIKFFSWVLWGKKWFVVQVTVLVFAVFSKDLLTEVEHDTKGEFEHFLVAILSARREENHDVDTDRAVHDASSLHSAEVQHWGHPESVFIDILATRSYKQLLATFQQFEKITGYDIEASIKEHMHGDVQKVMLALGGHTRSSSVGNRTYRQTDKQTDNQTDRQNSTSTESIERPSYQTHETIVRSTRGFERSTTQPALGANYRICVSASATAHLNLAMTIR